MQSVPKALFPSDREGLCVLLFLPRPLHHFVHLYILLLNFRFSPPSSPLSVLDFFARSAAGPPQKPNRRDAVDDLPSHSHLRRRDDHTQLLVALQTRLVRCLPLIGWRKVKGGIEADDFHATCVIQDPFYHPNFFVSTVKTLHPQAVATVLKSRNIPARPVFPAGCRPFRYTSTYGLYQKCDSQVFVIDPDEGSYGKIEWKCRRFPQKRLDCKSSGSVWSPSSTDGLIDGHGRGGADGIWGMDFGNTTFVPASSTGGRTDDVSRSGIQDEWGFCEIWSTAG